MLVAVDASMMVTRAVGHIQGLPVENGGRLVMFDDTLGVADGTFVMLVKGGVASTDELRDALGVLTGVTVNPVPVSGVVLTNGGIPTVCVIGGIEVMLLEGPGMVTETPVESGTEMFTEGEACVNILELSIGLTEDVEFSERGGMDDEAAVGMLIVKLLVTVILGNDGVGMGKGDRRSSELVPLDRVDV
ncbi:hypothetical protein GQ44DRAFT_344269 [Phaeosphaeriaceae sp. PMI808]|nr:hypothetical protein GQ44DRAFT_344269 [Phaeosphaeriaceae sp. PMI808]